MFSSKVTILSVFVFCLFTLGQAAPVLDDSLSTREDFSSLITRGFFSKLFHKSDPATDKLVKNVTETAHCRALHVLLRSEKEYTLAEKELTSEKNKLTAKGSKSSDPIVKEYTKQVKAFKSLAKKMASAAHKKEKELKKLGVKGGRAQCKAVAAAKASATSAVPTSTSTHTHSAPTSTPTHSSSSEHN